MALIKEQDMTEKNLAAHRDNGRKSRGAVTVEGKERARAANLRHGYYSKVGDEALAALGEDPADLEVLIAGAYEQWRPANPFQAWMTERLARLQLRMQRAERIQRSLELGRVQREEQRRGEQALELRRQTVSMFDVLGAVQEAAARPDYYTPREYVRWYGEAFCHGMTVRQRDLLELLQRLRKPPNWVAQALDAGGVAVAPSPAPPAGAEPDVQPLSDEDWEAVRADDDEAIPLPQPRLPVAEGEERESLRQDLQQWVAQELKRLDDTWTPRYEQAERPLTAVERDEVVADGQRRQELMQREEQACFREFMRLGNFLRKLQEPARDGERAPTRDRAQKGRRNGAGPRAGADAPLTSDAWRVPPENEGASGYVDENTTPAEMESVAEGSEPPADEAPEASPAAGQDPLRHAPAVEAREGEQRKGRKEAKKPKSAPTGRRMNLASTT
jgi:hypothetical protein